MPPVKANLLFTLQHRSSVRQWLIELEITLKKTEEKRPIDIFRNITMVCAKPLLFRRIILPGYAADEDRERSTLPCSSNKEKTA